MFLRYRYIITRNVLFDTLEKWQLYKNISQKYDKGGTAREELV